MEGLQNTVTKDHGFELFLEDLSSRKKEVVDCCLWMAVLFNAIKNHQNRESFIQVLREVKQTNGTNELLFYLKIDNLPAFLNDFSDRFPGNCVVPPAWEAIQERLVHVRSELIERDIRKQGSKAAIKKILLQRGKRLPHA